VRSCRMQDDGVQRTQSMKVMSDRFRSLHEPRRLRCEESRLLPAFVAGLFGPVLHMNERDGLLVRGRLL
jgi:hypothetical protein